MAVATRQQIDTLCLESLGGGVLRSVGCSNYMTPLAGMANCFTVSRQTGGEVDN